MSQDRPVVYPTIPNSVPAVKREMLDAVSAGSVDEFFADVPEELKLDRPLNLPPPLLSEHELRRHVEGLLARNANCQELLSFLGAGCYQHAVPAVCDEVNGRSEFLTAYAGEPYEDHGRFQALFEYCSLMGELLDMDVVNVPVYDGLQACATALRMAGRITGRRRVLVARTISADKRLKFRDYCGHELDIRPVDYLPDSGQLDLEAVRRQISGDTAAVYFENPSYFGTIETQGDEIARLAHEHGALCVVGVEPLSLGILAPPAHYGADIVCGDIQSLGMHMQYGGGQAGFIATRDEPRFVLEYPSRLFGIAPTAIPDEYGFGDVAYERTSFAVREEGKEWVGTASALWGITAGVYLALMGPQGMAEIGEGILIRTRYAVQKVAAIPGVRVLLAAGSAPCFREFVVNFDGTGQTAARVNRALLARGIVGGKDLSSEFPELGQSALYCVTEVHSRADIDRLVAALAEVVGQ
jgi:glycine dehydrogenase subunit 1